MKKPAALVLSLLLFATCLCPVCFAAEEDPFYAQEVPTDDLETYAGVLTSVFSTAARIEEHPIRDVRFGESHCAILFEDGTVSSFQTFAWYESTADFGECDTSAWKNVTRIACGAESTYGVKKDGSIVFSGCPNWLGFDVGGVESATLKAALSKKDYIDVATEAYRPLFLLKKDGTVLVELDEEDIYTDALQWKNIIDIEMDEGILYALEKDGTLHVSTFYGDNITGKVEDAVALKLIGCFVYAVLKDGSLLRLESVLPELSQIDDDCLAWPQQGPEAEDARYIWHIHNGLSDFGYLFETDDGDPILPEELTGYAMDDWKNLQNLYSWIIFLPTAFDSADQEEECLYYPEKACQVLFLGLFEDGSASVALCTNPG